MFGHFPPKSRSNNGASSVTLSRVLKSKQNLEKSEINQNLNNDIADLLIDDVWKIVLEYMTDYVIPIAQLPCLVRGFGIWGRV